MQKKYNISLIASCLIKGQCMCIEYMKNILERLSKVICFYEYLFFIFY